jgi:cell division protein FtsB
MKLRKFDLTVLAGSFALLGYLGWHGLYGPRSFTHRDALLATVENLKTELKQVRDEHGKLDRKAALMRAESLDPDMLDELARQYLNFAKGNELVLIQK